MTSLCDFEVYYSLSVDGNNSLNNNTWNPLPATGVRFWYSRLVSSNSSDVPDSIYDGAPFTAYHGFNMDGHGDGSYTQLAVTWYPDEDVVTYDLSQHAGNATSPFMPYGYRVGPETAHLEQYPLCNNLTCAAGEHPCTATYMEGK
jgi:hypothetical protein